MNRLYTTIAAILLSVVVYAQAPEKMSYQAVIRNANNNLVISSAVGMQISILQGSADGMAVYVERHFPTTNANGLVSIEVGAGTVISGSFTLIDWYNGSYFIKTETDLNGGANYTITGTSQLLSVPYALHARTAETVTGGITETDPVYAVSEAAKITATDITNLSNLLGTNTGDQNISGIAINMQAIKDTAVQIRADMPNVSGFLSSETDPVFIAWDKNYNDLTNKPTLFDGNYNSLSNLPTLFIGSFADLSDKPTTLAGYGITDAFDGNYNNLTNKPNIKDTISTYGFSGSYNDLTDRPSAISNFTMDANSQNITNLANPVNDQDAATKAYVDELKSLIENLTNRVNVLEEITGDGTPTVITGEITNILIESAIVDANVETYGGAAVTTRGIVWSTEQNSSLELNLGFIENGNGLGEFICNLTGLEANTTYYVKAYATNSFGTAYGNEQTFVTPITGEYDDNYTWTLSQDGVLAFYGSGDMENRYANYFSLPWSSYINNIKSIEIPEGLSKIGCFTSGSMDNIFNTTSTLKILDYIVDANNSNFSAENGVLFNKDKTELVSYPKGKTGAYIIPQSVISIAQWAFSNCTDLTSVTMQEGLVNLSYYCFGYCTSLTSVIIPSTVTSTGGDWCFDGCINLTDINVASENTIFTSIDGIWYNQTGSGLELKKCPEGREGAVTIPDGSTIGYRAFSECIKITSVSIPNSVVSIPTYAFEYCTNLASITIPSSVTLINNGAFTSAGIKDIYVLNQDPPTWNLNSDYGTFNVNTVTLHVPIGSKTNYESADNWKDCANIIEDL